VSTEPRGGESALHDAIVELAAPIVRAAGADLEEVELRGQRGSRLVRIVVDRDGGIDVDLITALSRDLGDALDAENVVEGRYTLEVSSPGATRPLRTGRDFDRNRGRPVRVSRRGRPELTGTVITADDRAVTLEVDGEQLAVPLDEVDHGRVVLPW
jgi:ribosome maturation factor RimP